MLLQCIALYAMIVTIPRGLTKQSTFYMGSDWMKNKVVSSNPIEISVGSGQIDWNVSMTWLYSAQVFNPTTTSEQPIKLIKLIGYPEDPDIH